MRKIRMQCVERRPLVIARMHQQRLKMAEWRIGKSLRRIVEERPTGECQRAN